MTEKVPSIEMAHAPEHANPNGPGQALRNARYALRKSEKDIANQFNLSKEYIIALENDEYEKLPGEAFIRGYLRAYAKVVNLIPDEVIAQFNETHFANRSKQAQQVTSSTLYLPNKKRDRRIRWIAYSSIAVFFLLVFLWWNNQTPPIESNTTTHLSALMQENIELGQTVFGNDIKLSQASPEVMQNSESEDKNENTSGLYT